MDGTDPFGVQPPNTNPAGLGTFTYNPRLPGQLYDAETAQFYNVNRNYDPVLGRYVQSDPIGLRGGINTYAYVNDGPLTRFDRRGLQSIAACANPANAAVCAEAGIGVVGNSGNGAAAAAGGVGAAGALTTSGDTTNPSAADGQSHARGFPPGFWPGDAGSKEWGRRHSCGAAEGGRRFHRIKQADNVSKPDDAYGVNPETGDVVDPEGEVVGNLNDG